MSKELICKCFEPRALQILLQRESSTYLCFIKDDSLKLPSCSEGRARLPVQTNEQATKAAAAASTKSELVVAKHEPLTQ